MNSKDINKFVELGFLLNKETFTIYGQEIVDNFVVGLIECLKKEGYKHYNVDLINNDLDGKYYRLNGYYFEIVSNYVLNNNEALDLYYLFSKFIKNTLGISFYEGYKDYYSNRYYFGYYINNLFTVKQNKKKVYIKFDLRKIFYSVYNEDDYFSYLVNNYVYLIPLHQNKSGVLSYANKLKVKLNVNVILNDDNISPLEKKKASINKRIGVVLYVGPKELKRQEVVIEFNNEKISVPFETFNINDYLVKSYKLKLNKNLKEVFLNEKEVTNINDLTKFNKVNLCDDCSLKGYQKYIYPFNKVSKSSVCILCKKEVKNLIFIKKRV